jgi:hypothetical protein
MDRLSQRKRGVSSVNRQTGLLLAVISFAWILAFSQPRARAQDRTNASATGATTECRSFRSPAGVQIDISLDRSKATDEDVAAVLEEAARQTRARLNQAPQKSVATSLLPQPGTPLDSLPAQPATAPMTFSESDAAARGPCGPVDERMEAPGDDSWLSWLQHLHGTGLPTTLLWEPPLANLHEPRMFVIPNDLKNAHTQNTIDTAIGGDIGLLRVSPGCNPASGVQQDFFAVVLSRFADNRIATAMDYRFGFPLTFACGNWSGKIGYEHTSTHLGDDFIQLTGQSKQGLIRDEIVVGCAYRLWKQFRVYGVFGYALSMSSPVGAKPERFDWGIEWSRQQNTGFLGQPFAAFDMELRAEQDYQPNLSTQIGWQWRADGNVPSLRLALEYYDGKSPYGQFFRDHEQWFGFGVFIDY